MTTRNVTLQVNRASHGATRVIETEMPSLAPGQVRFRIERFALTANTVTYATTGDTLGYWDFFPTGEPGWGSVPAMGWAEVVESRHPGVAAGGRYYGWYPMARYVDMTVTPMTSMPARLSAQCANPIAVLLDADNTSTRRAPNQSLSAK